MFGRLPTATSPRPDIATSPRPDIEGLRAIAVLAVMLWHAGVPGPRSGFVGVDIFFVLSGFLMTTQLVREQDRAGRASVTNFWARRAKRILPAAGVLLLGVALLTWLALPPVRWASIAQDLRASALFTVNWTFADRSTDYLALDEAPSPLLHFWSLAVEMQFYVGWPLLFIAVAAVLARVRRQPSTGRATAALVSLLVLVPSLVVSILQTAAQPERAYLLTRLRLWELALGGLVAALPVISPRLLPRPWLAPLAWLGLAGVLGSTFAFDERTAYPGSAALLPTVSTALVLLACQPTEARRPLRILALPALQRLGLWSYSLYLWHWPLLVVAASLVPTQGGHLTPWQGALVVAAAFLPAWLSFRFVETPLRRTPRWGLRPWALTLGFGVLTLGVAAPVALMQPWTLATRASAAELALRPPLPEVRADLPTSYAAGCHVPPEVIQARSCVEGTGGPLVALVGDSHAAQWLPPLSSIAQSNGWRVVTMTKSSCPYDDQPFATGRFGRPYPQCTAWVAAVERTLLDLHPAVVITSGSDMTATGPTGPLPQREGDLAIEAGYRSTWSRLTAAGIPVAVIADTPRPGFDVVDCLSGHPNDPAACSLPRDRALANRRDTIGRAAAAAADPLVSLIDLTDAICGPTQCAAVIDGVVVWRDPHHLTATFARSLGPALASQLPPLTRP